MNIQRGCLVSLSVRLFDAQGTLLEETGEPLVYLHGADDIFPGIEQVLEGHAEGAAVSVTLQPHETFGDDDAELVHLLPRVQLGKDAAVGMRYDGIPGREPDGRIYTLIDLADDVAVLDGNHPLAGRTLRFDLKVLSVSPASEEQLQQAERADVPEFLKVVGPQDKHPGGLTRH
jgi:FKBP-type peptidyl-prolyl cis-trans isomerase SlyD